MQYSVIGALGIDLQELSEVWPVAGPFSLDKLLSSDHLSHTESEMG
jgi:hypothetical protein